MIGATPPSFICRGEPPAAAAGVCAPSPGKPYFSVERRKPFAGESARSFF